MTARLMGSLCLLLTVACGGESKDQGPASDEPVGEVIEIVGAPAVQRGDQRVPLAVGTKVLGTDVVLTGDGGGVTIQLFHNQARWTLDANKEKRVDKSAAWRAPAQAAGGLLADNDDSEATAAAGRHAEKEAASTRATAALMAEKELDTDDDEGGTGTRMALDEGKMGKRDSTRDTGRYAVKGGDDGDGLADLAGKEIGDDFGKGGMGLHGTGRGGGGTGEGTIGLGNMGTIGKGGGNGSGYGRGSGGLAGKSKTAPKLRIGSPSVTGSLDKAIIRRVIRRNFARMKFCYEKELAAKPELAGKVEVDFQIAPDGKVVNAKVGGDKTLSEAIGTCVGAAFKAMTFPAPKGGGLVSVKYPITFAPGD